MLITFALGLGIGVAVAAAVGPISLLCVRRTLTDGKAVGLASGLGVAMADALYGSIAAFGLTLVSSVLIAQSHWFALIGGGVLIGLGIAIFREQPRDSVSATGTTGRLGAFASTFVLTLGNPMTILSFAAIFAGLGVPLNQGDYVRASVLVAGIFTGSALWWLLLIGGVEMIRHRITAPLIAWVNRVAGIVIVIFGAAAILRGLR